MIEYELGQMVKSKAGRDQDSYFLIVDISPEYVILVDGQSRRLEKPKRKKKKHVQITHLIAEDIAMAIKDGLKLNNADIRRRLGELLKQSETTY